MHPSSAAPYWSPPLWPRTKGEVAIATKLEKLKSCQKFATFLFATTTCSYHPVWTNDSSDSESKSVQFPSLFNYLTRKPGCDHVLWGVEGWTLAQCYTATLPATLAPLSVSTHVELEPGRKTWWLASFSFIQSYTFISIAQSTSL